MGGFQKDFVINYCLNRERMEFVRRSTREGAIQANMNRQNSDAALKGLSHKRCLPKSKVLTKFSMDTAAGGHAGVTLGKLLFDPNDFDQMEECLFPGHEAFERPLLRRSHALQTTNLGNCALIAKRMYEVLKVDAEAGRNYLEVVPAMEFTSPDWVLPPDVVLPSAGRVVKKRKL